MSTASTSRSTSASTPRRSRRGLKPAPGLPTRSCPKVVPASSGGACGATGRVRRRRGEPRVESGRGQEGQASPAARRPGRAAAPGPPHRPAAADRRSSKPLLASAHPLAGAARLRCPRAKRRTRRPPITLPMPQRYAINADLNFISVAYCAIFHIIDGKSLVYL